MTEDEAKTKWTGRGRKAGHSKGYIRILCPDHPNADKSGYVYEHIFVVSNDLGRGLERGEQVHHRDNNPKNNELKNLQIVSPSEHRLIHSDGKGAHSRRPMCAVCGVPILYAAKTGLCVEHYWQMVRSKHDKCLVDGCADKAGARSGLCRAHMRFRSNKRRFNPTWEFPNAH